MFLHQKSQEFTVLGGRHSHLLHGLIDARQSISDDIRVWCLLETAVELSRQNIASESAKDFLVKLFKTKTKDKRKS